MTKAFVLCHAACTGGSLIYRIIMSSYGFWGVSEVSPAWSHPKTAFHPLDPLGQLYSQDLIPPDEFATSFLDRISKCINSADANGKVLLIREHTHGLFFEHRREMQDWVGPSWIAAMDERLNVELPVVCTFRDPVDSWLGLRESFPSAEPQSFEKYCESYLRWIDAIEAWRDSGKKVITLNYESLIEDPQAVLDSVGQFLGMPHCDLEQSAIGSVTSGSSGRRSAKIGARKRRPFTSNFVKVAKESVHYPILADKLGYPNFCEQLTAADGVKAFVNGFTLPIAKQLPKWSQVKRLFSRFQNNSRKLP